MPMVKVITSASVDLEPLIILKQRGANISAIANRAIWEASGCSTDTLLSKSNEFKQEAKRIEDKQAEMESKRDALNSGRLNDFINKVSIGVIANELAMAYWSKQTGKSIEELIKLKKELKEPVQNGKIETTQ